MSFTIIPFQHDKIDDVKQFTDCWIGQDYFCVEELADVLDLSCSSKLNASFLAYDQDLLVGVRLSYLPGAWVKSARGITPALWPCQVDKVAYFKSLFIAQSAQKKGLGRTLSQKSLDVLKQAGAQAVVCHSWLESPEDSSRRYLQAMGFRSVASHEKFWEPIDYLCTRCTPKPCQCTAVEMLKILEERS